ncbi:MAG: sulfite exporter TauE/SafE family protein [Acidobacteria bacterium]|nr:sulfite exporter TauE/SafE family protein [Acidobacteriota bacterium]
MRIALLTLVMAAMAAAHPMGNFSVSHYARFDVRPGATEMTYALDLAEIPTFELTQAWKLDGRDPRAIEARAIENAPAWLAGLRVAADGRPVKLRFTRALAAVSEGAGAMPVLRVTIVATLAASNGRIQYDDTNYATRAGWKEIVVQGHAGVKVDSSTAPVEDRSRALTAYPTDAIAAPPQDLAATFHIDAPPTIVAAAPPPTPTPTPSTAPTFAEQQQAKAPGTVVRGDFLSRMLGGREITFPLLAAGLCVAFGLGAMHALSPGHGKTIVAAYLVGSRGTFKHALFLGGMVTFTHTVSVFLLGLGVLFFQKYVAPEKVIPALGAISGLSIVAIGAMLLVERTRRLAHEHAHAHGHHHHHHHGHNHHHHHGHSHSHVPEGPVTLASLIALGASGGLVPCPSALVLLLSAIALGRTGIGLMLLASFSAGLALVLMGIGVVVLYAKSLLPSRAPFASPALRYAPVFSAVVVMVLGLVMTGVSIGWIQPGRMIG